MAADKNELYILGSTFLFHLTKLSSPASMMSTSQFISLPHILKPFSRRSVFTVIVPKWPMPWGSPEQSWQVLAEILIAWRLVQLYRNQPYTFFFFLFFFFCSCCSTAVEHMPMEQNSWGRGFDSSQMLGFASSLSISQWCVLNQVHRGRATLQIFP